MLLPNYAEAVIPEDKLSGYCLNEEHPVGKDKAYLFRTLLNLTAQDSNWLRQQIEQAITRYAALPTRNDEYGQRYVVDFPVERAGQTVRIRTAWIVLNGLGQPRLTSCYVL